MAMWHYKYSYFLYNSFRNDITKSTEKYKKT
jgi:hypothetical protein